MQTIKLKTVKYVIKVISYGSLRHQLTNTTPSELDNDEDVHLLLTRHNKLPT